MPGLQVAQPPIGAPAPRSPAPIKVTRSDHPSERVFSLPGVGGESGSAVNPLEIPRLAIRLGAALAIQPFAPGPFLLPPRASMIDKPHQRRCGVGPLEVPRGIECCSRSCRPARRGRLRRLGINGGRRGRGRALAESGFRVEYEHQELRPMCRRLPCPLRDRSIFQGERPDTLRRLHDQPASLPSARRDR
jgi:hypothetical protein